MADDVEILTKLDDPMWRLTSGMLYKIVGKGDDGKDGLILNFLPNAHQRKLINRLHSRNIVLKARQLGFSTMVCILWLDTALFSKGPINCGVIAQDREAAEGLFGKIKFAYDNLPSEIRELMPTSVETKSRLVFQHNGASIKVATSMRSSTIHRLLVSEFGKICARSPEKASEVTTGSLPAVPSNGIVVIESTAEGQDGDFYRMTQQAEADAQSRKKLSKKDYRFHFFPWWEAQEYRLDTQSVIVSEKDAAYFDEVEGKEGITLDARQRAWYVATRKADFADDAEKMWQEYPSTSLEAFQRSNEGAYYTTQLSAARKEGRITTVPYQSGTPVNTFWDIGNSDGTAIWFHQRIGLKNHFIKFIEGWGEPYAHFVSEMQRTGYVWGIHYLPHDAGHVRQGQVTNISPKAMLENLGLRNIVIVPQVATIQDGIQATRDAFAGCFIDEAGCKEGIIHLQQYRKRWNIAAGCWSTDPMHDVHSEGADAFRQFAQGYKPDAANGPLKLNFRSQFRHG